MEIVDLEQGEKDTTESSASRQWLDKLRKGDQYIRIDEDWTDQNESLAQKWLSVANENQDGHYKAGKKQKCNHVVFGLPAVLIPSIFAPLTAALGNIDGIQYISMSGFILSAIFSGVHTFFGFNQKYQKHMDYSARYGDVSSDITFELAKQRRFRMQPDQFLQKIQMKLDSLSANAPDL